MIAVATRCGSEQRGVVSTCSYALSTPNRRLTDKEDYKMVKGD
jgi:hypothetical protein